MLNDFTKVGYDPEDKNVYSMKHVIICPEEVCKDFQN